ncbi:MAG TPA: phytoene synthase [Porticoccaceae bacterium]|jgi:phytoene synthase|nr:phytoene synthase [Porticoccaceae bacterium]
MENPQSRQVLARHGKSFYWASFFLGSRLANNAARLYEFCRFVDDLADGDLPNRQESLEDIRQSLDTGEDSTIEELSKFLDLAKECRIPLTAARELLDGMLLDQQPTEVKNEQQLLRYCHAVAGTVGLMMCQVLECKTARAKSFAIDLGIAMQLTNIARDVLEDAKMGRRYLPSVWFSEDIAIEDMALGKTSSHKPVADAIDRLLVMSEAYYNSALIGIRLLPFRSRLSIAIALRVYRQIGWVLQRKKITWWEGRVMVAAPEKIMLSLRSFSELLPLTVPSHNAELHKNLKGLSGVQ